MSELSQLVQLIADATKVVEAHAGPGDLALDKITSQSDALSSPEVREAIQIIEAATAQLVASVSRPSHNVVNVRPDLDHPRCTTANCPLNSQRIFSVSLRIIGMWT